MTKKKPGAKRGGKRTPSEGKTLGAPKGNQNAAKGVEKKLVSARIEIPVHQRLAAWAKERGIEVSAAVEQVLTERFPPSPKDAT